MSIDGPQRSKRARRGKGQGRRNQGDHGECSHQDAGGDAIGGVALGYLVPDFGWATASHILFLPILAVATVMLVIAKWDNRKAFAEDNPGMESVK